MYRQRHEEMTGRRFGRLTCIRFDGSNEDGMAKWVVRCDCGTEFTAYRANLVNGSTKSCGCLKRELLIQYNKNRKKPYESQHQ